MRYIELFGYSPNDPVLSRTLDSLEITERPKYEEIPMVWLSAKKYGVIMMFEERLGYEEFYGHAKGSEQLIFYGVRIHSQYNTDGFSKNSEQLPFDIDLDDPVDEFFRKLPCPDYQDDPGTPRRTFIWNNINGLEVSLVLTGEEKNIAYVSIKPSKISNSAK